MKAKRHYEKSHRESEKALEAYRKSDADIHLSRADVEKVSVDDSSFCNNNVNLLILLACTACRLLSKHDVFLCSATLQECQTRQMPGVS